MSHLNNKSPELMDNQRLKLLNGKLPLTLSHRLLLNGKQLLILNHKPLLIKQHLTLSHKLLLIKLKLLLILVTTRLIQLLFQCILFLKTRLIPPLVIKVIVIPLLMTIPPENTD